MDRLLEATYLAEQHHFWFRGFARFVQPLVEAAVKGVARPEILDCGCGTGANMKRLSRYGRVTGFDISHHGLQFAHSYDQRRIVRASITDIPFASGSFDLVTSFDVLSTLDDTMERQALAEIRRVLRPRGALVVNTAALRFLHGQHAVFASEVRRLSRGQLRASLERSGFRISRLTYTLVIGLGMMRSSHYSLPNVLANEPVVPELMQGECTAENLAAALERWLSDAGACETLERRFLRIHERLRGGGSAAAAQAVSELLETNPG